MNPPLPPHTPWQLPLSAETTYSLLNQRAPVLVQLFVSVPPHPYSGPVWNSSTEEFMKDINGALGWGEFYVKREKEVNDKCY